LHNCKRDIFHQVQYLVSMRKRNHLAVLLGFEIPSFTFGPGLSIAHRGPIIVHENARIGSNCRIHPCVIVGTQVGCPGRAPHLGDNIFIGPGAMILGPIEIADNIAIGANSVVNKSFTEPGITIAGAPAKKISKKGSFEYYTSTSN
jgi:serine O-acetyltransferase